MRKLFAILVVIGIGFLVYQGSGMAYGKKLRFGKGELYYKDPVTEKEAKEVGNYLLKKHFFHNKNRTSAQVLKKKDLYQIRMVTKEDVYKGKNYHLLFRCLINKDLLAGKKIELHLCNTTLTTQVKFLPFYCKKNIKNKLYYNIKKEEADKLEKIFLKSNYFKPKSEAVVIIEKQKNKYILRLFTDVKIVKGRRLEPRFVSFGKRVLAELFPKNPGEIRLLDAGYSCYHKAEVKPIQ